MHTQNRQNNATSYALNHGADLSRLLSSAADVRAGAELTEEPLFSDLSPDDLQLICTHGTVKTYRKNTLLITEDEPGGSFYVIRKGKVKVYVAEENGREFILSVLGPGEYFGELALIAGGARSASVVTMEKCQLSVVSRADFERCLAAHPKIALAVIRRLVCRLRSVTADVKSLALRDVYGRVARKLIELSVGRDGTLVIEERLTQQDIACMVGASREMVSRIMKGLVTGGYIEIEDKRMIIRRKLPPGW